MFIQNGNIAEEMTNKKNSSDLVLLQEASEEDIKIEHYIREQYSLSMELALHRKKAMGVVDETEWQNYCDFVQECIAKAREELNPAE